jgi:hypothetical protein
MITLDHHSSSHGLLASCDQAFRQAIRAACGWPYLSARHTLARRNISENTEDHEYGDGDD